MSSRALGVETQTVEPTLITMAERIGALHREIKAQPGRYAEMNSLLTQAKKDAGEGGWLKWLTDNRKVLGFGVRQAQNYLLPGEARASHKARHAEGEKKRRAATKASKATTTELAPASPNLPEDATEVLPETEPPQGLEAAGSYLGELVKVSSSMISQIKETVKSKRGVSTKDHEAATKAV